MSDLADAARMTGTVFRVLVVDDDPDMAAFLARLLTREGMAAETVADAEAAFARVGTLPPDMIQSQPSVRYLRLLRSEPPVSSKARTRWR